MESRSAATSVQYKVGDRGPAQHLGGGQRTPGHPHKLREPLKQALGTPTTTTPDRPGSGSGQSTTWRIRHALPLWQGRRQWTEDTVGTTVHAASGWAPLHATGASLATRAQRLVA
eukprot:5046835-Amphidinium_carterae.1